MRGHSEAQWHLGQAYELGKGTPRDLIEAYAWYRCAIAGAKVPIEEFPGLQEKVHRASSASLASLRRKLSPDQFLPAEQLAEKYIQSYALRKDT